MKRFRVPHRRAAKQFHRTAKASRAHHLNSALGSRGGIRL